MITISSSSKSQSMKKNYISICAMCIAILAIAFTTHPNSNQTNFTNYFFKFIGTPGVDEDDETKWVQITQAEYEDDLAIPCPGTLRGCKFITTSVTGTPLRPTLVNTVIQSGGKQPVHQASDANFGFKYLRNF